VRTFVCVCVCVYTNMNIRTYILTHKCIRGHRHRVPHISFSRYEWVMSIVWMSHVPDVSASSRRFHAMYIRKQICAYIHIYICTQTRTHRSSLNSFSLSLHMHGYLCIHIYSRAKAVTKTDTHRFASIHIHDTCICAYLFLFFPHFLNLGKNRYK